MEFPAGSGVSGFDVTQLAVWEVEAEGLQFQGPFE